MLGEPLDPWQQWLVIHAGEMLEDGRPRFRQVLVIVARQNGKTHLCVVLALFWMFVERWPMIFGTSTNLEQARESWEAARDRALAIPALAGRIPKNGVRIGNGQQTITTTDRSRYKIGAADRKGGRGKVIDRAIGDELREQRTWDAYHAAYNAMNARPRAQVFYITNMGDASAVVLNSLRSDALDDLETGMLRPVGLFEWSAPAGTHPMDPAGHAAANPQYGRRMDPDVIMSAARRVSKPGADPEEHAGFMTEILCVPVDQLDPAIDPVKWEACGVEPGPIPDGLPVVACLDVSPDHQHATLAAAAILEDGRARVEVVAAWSGPTAMAELRSGFREWVARIRPVTLGWVPKGPAAALDADLRDRRKKGRYAWPPRGTSVVEITEELSAVCMGFAEQVIAGQVRHSAALEAQRLLGDQAMTAEKIRLGGRWVFGATGQNHVDGLYAAAGAVHLARTAPFRRRGTGTVHGVVVNP